MIKNIFDEMVIIQRKYIKKRITANDEKLIFIIIPKILNNYVIDKINRMNN